MMLHFTSENMRIKKKASVWALTNVWDVERKPVQESIADQFGKQQTERELQHALCETYRTMKTSAGDFDHLIISTTLLYFIHS